MLSRMVSPRRPWSSRRARRRRRVLATALGLGMTAGGAAALCPDDASAAVRGRGGGVEIEGARDRRGFFVGTGASFGGTFFYYDDFIPAMRLDVALGGGVTRNFTLGANLHLTPYLSPGIGVGFGADVEATAYVWRGFYLRSGLGASGVPARRVDTPDDKSMTVGLGGAFGLGYEFFLNSTAAMSTGLTYDARFIPGDGFPRQTLLVGVRFSWF